MITPKMPVHPRLSGDTEGSPNPAAEVGGALRGVFLEEGTFEIGFGR